MAAAVVADAARLRGKMVIDAVGKRLGTIGDVFFDEHTGRPEWASVDSGFLGVEENLVPLAGARVVDQDTVQVRWDQDRVRNAPSVSAGKDLTQDKEQKLHEYYGME